MRLFCCVFLLFQTALAAQQPRFFKHFTEKDGLSDAQITAIHRDRQGWLWVGTARGLNRWDGQKFQQFLPDAARPQQTVSNENINDIEEDSEGFVWIATRDGLNRFDPRTETFKVFKNTGRDDRSLPNSLVTNVLAEKTGGLWLCCDNRNLSFFDSKTSIFKTFDWKKFAVEALPETTAKDYRTIFYLTEKSPSELWLHTNLGLFSFEKTTGRFQFHLKFLNEKLPAAAKTTCSKTQFLGSWDADVLRFDGCAGKFSQVKLPIPTSEIGGRRQVFQVVQMGKTQWILARKGLFLLDENLKTEALAPARENCFSAPTGSISNFFKEADGTVWLGGEAGLWQFDPRLQHFQFNRMLPDDFPNSFYNSFCRVLEVTRNSSSAPQAGSRNRSSALLARFVLDFYGRELSIFRQGKFLKKIKLPAPAALLFQTRDGRIWVGSGSQIFNVVVPPNVVEVSNLDDVRLVELSIPKNLTDDDPPHIFQDMTEDAAGNLWFASDEAGIFIFSPTKNEWRKPSEADGFIGKSITCLLADTARRVVWAGSDEYGLFQFDEKTGAWRLFQHDPQQPNGSLAAFMVRGLCLDGAGNLWAATDPGGLSRFDGEQFRNLGTTAGLPSNQVCSVAADRAGNVWAGTTRGLAWVDFRTLRVRSFDRRAGLENDFLDLPLSVSRATGEVFAGGKFGFTSFSPDSLLMEKTSGKILLTAFKIFDKKLSDSLAINHLQKIELDWRENFFSIEFASADFLQPEKNEFSYRLLGFDADWKFCGRTASAAYTNVPPGDYFLEIRSGREGRWHEAGLRLPIHIEPPFWQTWWFRLLAVAAVAGLILGIYKNRVARIRREEGQKTEFNRRLAQVEMSALRAQMNPHFVFNCLSSINRFILVNDAERASDYLTKFSRLIRLVLDNSRSELVPLDRELDALKLYIELERMRFDERFDFEIRVAAGVPVSMLEIPPLLVQPFVENAIWHGLLHSKTAGRLLVEVSFENQILKILVEDNGIGRAEAAELKSKSAVEHKSHGLQVTAERLAVINQIYGSRARVEILDLVDSSGLACGTRVLIFLAV